MNLAACIIFAFILWTGQLSLNCSVLGISMDDEVLRPVDGKLDSSARFPSLAELDIRNDLGDLTSDVDYFERLHSRRRRIKKVLPPEMPPFIEESGEDVGFRKKRFIESRSPQRKDLKSFKYYSKASSDQHPKIVRIVSKQDTNMSGIELKYFQNGLLSALRMSCPAVAEKHSLMLRTVEESAENEIRSALANHQQQHPTTVTLRMDDLWALVRKIKKCGKAFADEQMHRKIETAAEIPSKRESHGSRFAGIRKHFEEEAKRFALMSQLDVIPTPESVASIFELIQEHIVGNCFVDSMKKVAEDVGELLIETIRMKKEKRFGKSPTLHQREMENLLNDTKTCFLNLPK